MGTKAAQPISDQQISDAYIYMLGRLLITRQQHADFAEGMKWNELVYRQPGKKPWSLTFRICGPRGGVADASYYPPALQRRA